MEVLLYFDYILCCQLYPGRCKLFLTSKEHKNRGVKAVGDWHATKNIFLFRYGMSLFCLQILQGVMLKLLSSVLAPQCSGLGSLLISQNMDLQQNFLCRAAPWQSFLQHHCRHRYAINRVVQFQSFSLIFFSEIYETYFCFCQGIIVQLCFTFKGRSRWNSKLHTHSTSFAELLKSACIQLKVARLPF